MKPLGPEADVQDAIGVAGATFAPGVVEEALQALRVVAALISGEA